MSSECDCKARLNQVAEEYVKNGYAVIPEFLSEDEVAELRDEFKRLVQQETGSGEEKQRFTFTEKNNYSSKYFLDSGDKVVYFYENEALDPETGQIKVQKEISLAKIGHALHYYNPVVKKHTFTDKVKDVLKAIGFRDPVVVQSMVIFKNPKIGHAYAPHQDAAYLCAEPHHLIGFWIALDDATEENGCLDFIPGSHKKLEGRLVRTGKTEDGDKLLEWTASPPQYDDKDFVPVPVKRGDLVILHGLVVHRSSSNTSQKSRWVYTFHSYDKGRAVWCKDNWLQMNTAQTFMEVYSQ